MKGKLPIIVAIVLGIVAVLAIRSYVQQIEADAARQLEGRLVLFAAADIDKGASLTEEMLTTDSVPEQFIPRQAITSTEEMRQILGRKTRVAVPAGNIILWSDLEVDKRGGLSSLIPEGERAFTVDLSDGVNVDLLQLNDRVDIIGLFQEPAPPESANRTSPLKSEKDRTVCVVLLQSVNIMAIGTTIGETYGMPTEEGGGNVTFSVTLPEAQLLMYASNHGDLALVLRREGEIEVLAREELPRVTMETLENLITDLDSQRSKRVVQIIQGNQIEEIEVDVGGETDKGLQSFE